MSKGSIRSFEALLLKNKAIDSHPQLASKLQDYLAAIATNGHVPDEEVIDAIYDLAPSKTDAQTILEDLIEQLQAKGLALAITSDGGGQDAVVYIEENTTEVTIVSANDPQDDQVAYSITGGVDASMFDIDEETGALTLLAAPDFESDAFIFEVIVQASDATGNQTDTQTIVVHVQDANDAPIVSDADVTGSLTRQTDTDVLFFDDFDRQDSDYVGGGWVEVAETNSPYTNAAGQSVDSNFAEIGDNQLHLTAEINPDRLNNFYNRGGGALTIAVPLDESAGDGEITISFEYQTGPDESGGPRIGLMNSQSGFEGIFSHIPVEGIGMSLYRSDSNYSNTHLWVEHYEADQPRYSPGGPHYMPFQVDYGTTYYFTVSYVPGGQITIDVSDGENSFSFSEDLGPISFDLDQLYIVGGAGLSYGSPGLQENTNSIDNLLVVQESEPDQLSTSGTISFTDDDLSDTHTITVTPAGEDYAGTFTFTLDDSTGDGEGAVDWIFEMDNAEFAELGSNESVDQTYNLLIDDGNGGSVSESVVITINGVDDFIF